MTTTTRSLIRWGVLATPPRVDRTGDTPLIRLRLLRTNNTAIAAGATEFDASRIIDLTVNGELPEVTFGIAEVGDRVHINGGTWTDRPRQVNDLHVWPEQVDFPILYE